MPSVTVDVSEDMMFADIANLKDISEMENDTRFSTGNCLKGKITYQYIYTQNICTWIHRH